jgi:hypothetical protein
MHFIMSGIANKTGVNVWYSRRYEFKANVLMSGIIILKLNYYGYKTGRIR